LNEKDFEERLEVLEEELLNGQWYNSYFRINCCISKIIR
jgi:hypothetical protein